MRTSATVIRRGQPVEVELHWQVRGACRHWNERHPYGSGTATEAFCEPEVEEVELQREEWPAEHDRESLSRDEFKEAEASAWEQARENPHECIGDHG